MEIQLKSGPAKDRHASDRQLLARICVSDEDLTLWIGDESQGAQPLVAPLWEHAVYELENLSKAFELAASGGMPRHFETMSADCLLGPKVNLWPAVIVEVGHPGANAATLGATFFLCTLDSFIAKRRLVIATVCWEGRCKEVRFEESEALAIASELYDAAKSLAPKLISWGEELSETS